MNDSSFLCPEPQDGRFISWAQNAEDVLLRRLFSGQKCGFWIDIGANHPFRDSVTKNLYDQGWYGINVEPVGHFFDLLELHRPRDVNLRCVAGATGGTVSFSVNQSNFDLSRIASAEGDIEGLQPDQSLIEVPMMTVREILQSYASPGITVDFLKIDVEGFEVDVLRGCDLARMRPRVAVVETSVQTKDSVVDLCQTGGLIHAHWDGVNDWFIDEKLYKALDHKIWRPTHPVLDGYHPWIYQVLIADLQRQMEFDRSVIESLTTGES